MTTENEAEAPQQEPTYTMKTGRHQHDIDPQLGLDLREMRESHGLTRVVLSSLIGRTERTISRWETQGTTQANYWLATDAIKTLAAAHENASAGNTKAGLPADLLQRATTLDLALELANRARRLEERNAALNDLKAVLESRGLGRYIPDNL